MRPYKPDGDEEENVKPAGFDPFAAPPPSVPNKRQERLRRRRRHIRMALTTTLPVALCMILIFVFKVQIAIAVAVVLGLFHLIMGIADMILGERREPEQEPDTDTYARWFGFRDW
ncbi:MAG: hypothetical protein AB8H86_13685 [Polyangiales bacterium]